jgi:hypothetical protein
VPFRRTLETECTRKNHETPGRVLSLVDFMLYPRNAQIRLRTLEEKTHLTEKEKLQLAQSVAIQIWGALTFRKVSLPQIEMESFRVLLRELGQLSGVESEEPPVVLEHYIGQILEALLAIRSPIYPRPT